MELLANFVETLALVLTIAIFARAILSWFPNVSNENPLIALVYHVTEPILAPLRSVVPKVGMMDISPMVAIIILFVIRIIFASI